MPKSNADLGELLAKPREALDVEIKGWLNLADNNQRADLAKAIIAIANSGGGYVVIGLSEDSAGQFTPGANRPANMEKYSQDSIQDIVQRYLEPPVQCRVEHVDHPAGHGRFPIVVVPGEHRTPIKARAGSPDNKLIVNRVYIRRPGPRSEEPQTAADWDQLFERALRSRSNELLDGMRNVISSDVPKSEVPNDVAQKLTQYVQAAIERWNTRVAALPADSPPRFPYGFYDAAFAIDGNFPREPLSAFRNTFQGALKSHSGWPPFVYMTREIFKPVPVDGSIEAWIGPRDGGAFDTPAHHDFWRASPEGLFFTRRGYNEDGHYKGMEPGVSLDITTPTWRIGEILLQAFYIATAMGAKDADLLIRFKWTGLSGRKLVSVGNPNRVWFNDRYAAHQAEYEAEKAVAIASIYDGLPEIVFDILKPLYSLFDFWALPKRLVEEELRELRKNTFY